jgi:hypothetical protein
VVCKVLKGGVGQKVKVWLRRWSRWMKGWMQDMEEVEEAVAGLWLRRKQAGVNKEVE